MLDPTAFTIFSLEIKWYGITYALGFLFTYFFITFYAKDFGFKKDKLEDIFFYTMIFSLLGGRLGYIFFYNLSYYLQNPFQILAVWQGGMSIHGAIIAGFLTIYFLSGRYKLNFFKLTDLFVIPLSLALAFGRLANFVNQELVGNITNSKLGLTFPLYDNENRLPYQLFASIKNMITFQILLYLAFYKKLKPGILTAIFLILYSFGRFLIDFTRVPTTDLGLISLGQLLSLAFGIFGLYLLYYLNKN